MARRHSHPDREWTYSHIEGKEDEDFWWTACPDPKRCRTKYDEAVYQDDGPYEGAYILFRYNPPGGGYEANIGNVQGGWRETTKFKDKKGNWVTRTVWGSGKAGW